MTHDISRRGALAGLAGVTLIPPATAASAPAPPPTDPQSVCLMTPQSDQGPFYVDPKLVRTDITERRPGIPLEVRMTILAAGRCTPLKDVRVDIWHADARGIYSGFEGQSDTRRLSTVGKTFLRGTQLSDANGLVRFTTIYPGWYDGRAPHIHIKAFVADRDVLTAQMYFPDALSEYIYTHHSAYTGRPRPREIVNINDGIILDDDPRHLGFAGVAELPDRYVASLTLGVDPTARATPPDIVAPPDMAAPDPARRGPPPPDVDRGPPRPPHLADRAEALLPGGRR